MPFAAQATAIPQITPHRIRPEEHTAEEMRLIQEVHIQNALHAELQTMTATARSADTPTSIRDGSVKTIRQLYEKQHNRFE